MSGLSNIGESIMGIKAPQPAAVYVPAPPTTPANDAASQAQQSQSANAAIAAAESGGKASTVLTGPLGKTNEDQDETIARKTLLGST